MLLRKHVVFVIDLKLQDVFRTIPQKPLPACDLTSALQSIFSLTLWSFFQLLSISPFISTSIYPVIEKPQQSIGRMSKGFLPK